MNRRIRSVSISGFRAFAGEYTFELDADVVILSGPNGSGKTSFFDSILWALTGGLPRFEGRQTDAISLYSPSGTARVVVRFDTDTGPLTVTRTAASEERSQLLVETAEARFEGSSAELTIFQDFWPPALQTEDAAGAFCTAFTRSVYLQQDLVREFIESDSEDTRFTVLSELVGAGRLNDFLRELESNRNAWSRARTEKERELEDAEQRVTQIRARLERLSDAADAAALQQQLFDWWSAARAVSEQDLHEPSTVADATRALNSALSVLQAERHAITRRHDLAQRLLEAWASLADTVAPDLAALEQLRNEHGAAIRELEVRQTELEAAQASATRERQRLVEQRERDEELRSLATLALRHLDEKCPVCDQTYDIENTRRRLQALVATGPTDETPEAFARVAELTAAVAALEGRAAKAADAMGSAQRAVEEMQAWEAERTSRLTEIQLPRDADQVALAKAVESLSQRRETIGRVYTEGESLAVALARAAEASQRAELERQLEAAERAAAERQRALAQHEETGNAANTILEATRQAARQVVDARVQRIEPLVERIYARMDPHPAFTKIGLVTTYPRGRGRIRPVVSDPTAGIDDRDPYTLFSSSQLNALAVSLFLGLNLGTQDAPLSAVMLDDPLQSLDDVNLLGLVDTLRRTKSLRQLLVSTHDRRLTSLLQRKLRPVGDDRATRVYAFSDWKEEGPTVAPSEVEAEPAVFGIAAA